MNNTIIRLNTAPQGFGDTPDELEADMFVQGEPVQHSHSDYEDDDLGLYVGVWDTNDMHEAPGPYAMDEFMWLIEGEANIKNLATGELENVKAGEAFVIPKGYECQWQQTGYLRKFYVISEHPEEGIPSKPTVEGIVKPHANAPTTAFDGSALFAFSKNVPQQHNDVSYQNGNGAFTAGTFDSQAFKSEQQAFSKNMFAYLLQGSLTLTDDQAVAHTFNAGDAFFIPKGTICSWQCDEYARFNYAALAS